MINSDYHVQPIENKTNIDDNNVWQSCKMPLLPSEFHHASRGMRPVVAAPSCLSAALEQRAYAGSREAAGACLHRPGRVVHHHIMMMI